MGDKDKRSAFTTVVMSDIENNTQEVVYNSYTLPLLFNDGTNMSKLIEKIEAVPDKGITIQNDIVFYDNTYESAEDTFEFVMITLNEDGESNTYSLADLIEDGYTITPFISADGGGGDSDFSTATVTFVMTNYEDGYSGDFDLINVNGDYINTLFTSSVASSSAQAVLYKGKAYTSVGDITSVEGNATLGDAEVEITGDCTINFTGHGMS